MQQRDCRCWGSRWMMQVPTTLKSLPTTSGVNYPILVGEGTVGDAYGGLPFLPSTFYIGRDGKLVDRAFGLKTRSEIEEDIKKALAQAQSDASSELNRSGLVSSSSAEVVLYIAPANICCAQPLRRHRHPKLRR